MYVYVHSLHFSLSICCAVKAKYGCISLLWSLTGLTTKSNSDYLGNPLAFTNICITAVEPSDGAYHFVHRYEAVVGAC